MLFAMRLSFWVLGVGLAVGSRVGSAQPRVSPVVVDQLRSVDAVRIEGYLGRRLDASYEHRILEQDVDHLVAPFRNRTEVSKWQSEFWGKWFTSAVQAYRYRPEPRLKAVLDKAVAGLLATQTPDGYIGNYAPDKHLEQWDIWGRKYCMLGLLAYYDLTKDTRSLQAARQLADHLMRELAEKNALLVKKGNHRGMAASSVLEPITQLYVRTADKRYLDFAQEIVRQWETPDGPQLISKAGQDVARRFPKPASQFGWEQGQKAYEMMSCYEGLLELYRLTGNQTYRNAVEKTWENIRDTEINVAGSGASIEVWFGGKNLQTLPVRHYQETCVTVTWIKLSQQLLRLTGEARYADAIEQSYYNALLGAMQPDGADWAKYSPLAGQRLEGEGQCGMDLNCCVASGPRGLFTLPATVVMTGADGPSVNFFVPGRYSFLTPGGQQAAVRQQTTYPDSGTVRLTLDLSKAEELSVRIRVPAWSAETTLLVNGQPVNAVQSGQYATIRRRWSPTDVITLGLDMRGRLVRQGPLAEHVAIRRGPLVLARDSRLDKLSIDEPLSPLVGKDGFIALEPVTERNPAFWVQYTARFAVESHLERAVPPVSLHLCDYASAGNTYDERSRFRVWLPQLVDTAKLP